MSLLMHGWRVRNAVPVTPRPSGWPAEIAVLTDPQNRGRAGGGDLLQEVRAGLRQETVAAANLPP